MGNVCSVAKSLRNRKITFCRHLRFPSSFMYLDAFFNLHKLPVLFVIDKRELKEWKKMVEKQLTEKAREPCDAEVSKKTL